jgi:hypothetical protein
MRFVNPAFLFALSSISIPIIIHLFNFRKFKTVYFTNVRFLREVKEETQSKSQLKHLLILLARILALVFLVLAFAQPYIPFEHQKINPGAKAISVFIDNSFSMDAENKSGRLLDEAKKDAREIAASARPTDQFQLLTNDFEGRHQRLVNREEFLELLEEVKLSPAVRTLPEIFSRQADLLNNSGAYKGRKSAFIISDFLKSVSAIDQIKNDTSIATRLVPVVAQERRNLYIDSCWFETPVRKLNQPEALHVRIRNASAQEYANVPMKLFINGQQKTPSSFSIGANGKVDTVIAFTVREPGWQQGRVELTDSPITFDDKFFFSFEVSKTIAILCIEPASKSNGKSVGEKAANPIGNLFRKDSSFRYTEVLESAIDYAALSKNEFIILDGLNSISSGLGQELKRFVQAGGSLLIFPSLNIDIPAYSGFLGSLNVAAYTELDTARSKVDALNFEQEIYREGVFEKRNNSRALTNAQLDLPVVFNHYRISRNSHSNEEYLMKLRNKDIFLAKYNAQKGNVYLCTSSLTAGGGNFQKHALFVPTILQIAFFSTQQNKLFCTIGRNDLIELNSTPAGGENVFHISSADNKFDIIPEHRIVDSKTELFTHDQIREAGNYNLLAGKEQLQGLSFNYDRKESDLECLKPEELKAACEKAGLINFSLLEGDQKGLASMLSEINQGKKLWKWCIILALLCLAAEVALLRLLKN